ncbi:GDSL-type esterase/lipase family protein [Helicobacter mustelae]|uniref:Putative periplasmic protein n=1 Tax=Helicobacter mustelae (strain ATCC 43772 / CCUG 25715 / CIP 103759 / LMG 18044 / NCTC 12198 / R85-136P) TaxID=679897 RepID=D3UGN4_HELM1|nr:GDSL-type esterase/lipase family protein [Helicobacter mustelae]CBG39655.1 Putative periplasmic protein [Helicobacter mustelae 12198]SQH71165.1 periplasmic protein [Helicobacter mustelae]
MRILCLVLGFFWICMGQDAFWENYQESSKPLRKIIQSAKIQNFSSQNLDLLREKIQKKEDLKIHILGDSHIAADIFSDELRRLFFTPNAIGFVYPLFPAFHRNALLQIQSKGFEVYNSLRAPGMDYPMGGVIAQAKNSEAFINLDTTLPKKTYKIRFVFKSPNHLASFCIKDAQGKSLSLNSKNPGFWEISKPYKLSLPLQIHALLRNGMLGGYFIYNQEDNNIIDHMGINGARSDLWLQWNQEILNKEMQVLQYDLIILSYGSNDAISNVFDKKEFLRHYKSLIRKLRKYNPNAVILLIGPPTVVAKQSNKQYIITQNFAPVKSSLLALAKEENLLYFDWDALMQKNGKKAEWIALSLSKKDVHLTPKGYRLTANAVYKSLLDILGLDP